MDNLNDPGDEIAIDPLPVPNIPVPRALPAIVSRLPRAWRPGGGRRLTWRDWRGWLAAAIAAVVVIGALKLAGVIWSGPPAWVAALGPGVTVTGPEQVKPGNGSPGAALIGLLAALSAKDFAATCDYVTTDISAANCKAQFAHVPKGKLELPYSVSVKVGYVAIDGTRALVGYTGKICSPADKPPCVTNTDPAAIFSTGKTFAALWARTVGADSGNAYTLLPCLEVGGKWYFGSTTTSIDS